MIPFAGSIYKDGDSTITKTTDHGKRRYGGDDENIEVGNLKLIMGGYI